MYGKSCAEMPHPLSLTVRVNLLSVVFIETIMSPSSGVNFMAFEMRLPAIFVI